MSELHEWEKKARHLISIANYRRAILALSQGGGDLTVMAILAVAAELAEVVGNMPQLAELPEAMRAAEKGRVVVDGE